MNPINVGEEEGGITISKKLEPLQRDGTDNTSFNPYAVQKGDVIKVTITVSGLTLNRPLSIRDEVFRFKKASGASCTQSNISAGGVYTAPAGNNPGLINWTVASTSATSMSFSYNCTMPSLYDETLLPEVMVGQVNVTYNMKLYYGGFAGSEIVFNYSGRSGQTSGYNYAPSYAFTRDSYVNAGTMPNFQNMAISVWFKNNQSYNSNPNKYYYLSQYFEWTNVIRIMGNASVDLIGWGTSPNEVSWNPSAGQPNPVLDNGWHNIIVSRGDSTIDLFIDGNLKASYARSGGGNGANGNLRLGYGWDGSVYKSYEGNIDEFRIYFEGLSLSDAQSIYQGNPPTTNMSAWWAFSDDTLQPPTGSYGSPQRVNFPAKPSTALDFRYDPVAQTNGIAHTNNVGTVQSIEYWIRPKDNTSVTAKFTGGEYLAYNGYPTNMTNAKVYKNGQPEVLSSTELVVNGDFESDLSSWSAWRANDPDASGAIVENAGSPNGGKAFNMKMNSPLEGNHYFKLDQTVNGIERNKLYKVSMYYKGVSPTNSYVWFDRDGFWSRNEGWDNLTHLGTGTQVVFRTEEQWVERSMYVYIPNNYPFRSVPSGDIYTSQTGSLMLSAIVLDQGQDITLDGFSVREVTNPITPADGWQHVVVTTDHGLDGTVVDIGNSGYVNPETHNDFDPAHPNVTNYNLTYEYPLDGQVDNVRFFNGVLTQAEAAQHYVDNFSTTGEGTYWGFNDGSGNVLSSNMGYSGSLSNQVYWLGRSVNEGPSSKVAGGYELFGFDHGSLKQCLTGIIMGGSSNQCFKSNSMQNNILLGSSRAYGDNIPSSEASVLFYPNKALIKGDSYAGTRNLTDFAYWGRNLAIAKGTGSTDAFWGVGGYNAKNSDARASLVSGSKEYTAYKARIDKLMLEATYDTSLAASPGGLWQLQKANIKTGGLDESDKYPQGKVWIVGGDLTISSSFTYSGKGTIIVLGNLLFNSNITGTAQSSGDRLGFIVYGGGGRNITFRNNNKIQAVMLAPDTNIIFGGAAGYSGSNSTLVGSFVAKDFDFSYSPQNTQFVYDYGLNTAWPPGFGNLSMPQAKE